MINHYNKGEMWKFIQQRELKLIFKDDERMDVTLEAAKLENSNVKLIVLGKHSKL